MKLDELKKEDIIKVIRLYEEYCSFGRNFENVIYEEPSTILEELKKYHCREYRIGSRWGEHSKIYFEVDSDNGIVVRFNSNFSPEDRKGRAYKVAEKSGQKFVEAAMQYLNH